MPLLRQLDILSGLQPTADGVRAAFATSDGVTVDQHLGAASTYLVYLVDNSTAAPITIGDFATSEGSGHEHRLAGRLEWLGQCDLVYAAAIGSSASRRLLARGVLPLRTVSGTEIKSLLPVLQSELNDSIANWRGRNPRLESLTARFSKRNPLRQQKD